MVASKLEPAVASRVSADSRGSPRSLVSDGHGHTLSKVGKMESSALVSKTMSSLEGVGRILTSGRRGNTSTLNIIERFETQDMDELTTKRLTELVMFTDCEDLCRGVPLLKIMKSAGTIFARAGGSSATYAMSTEVERISAFISHNWATPRFKKQLVLIMHYNLNTAAIVGFSIVILGGFAGAYGLMPEVNDKVYGQGMGILCRLLCNPILLTLLFCSNEIAALLGRGGRTVFLDKVCINQGDPAVMLLGIKKLGAFIARSERMVVVYTDVYLKKLWTVYEVAAFLSIHSASNMDVLPMAKAKLFVGSIIIMFCYNILSVLAKIFLSQQQVVYIILFGMAYGYLTVVRSWWIEREAAVHMLTTFTVRAATCAVESDRPIVYSNIAFLMQAKGLVSRSNFSDSEDCEESALDAFDLLVRETLPQAFSKAFGRTVFDYKHYVVLGLSMGLSSSMDYWIWLHAGTSSLRAVAAWTLLDLFNALTLWPMGLLTAEFVAWRYRRVHGWRAHIFTIPLSIPCILPFIIVIAALLVLGDAAAESDGALALLAAIGVLGPALPLFAIHGRCRCPRRGQKSRRNTWASVTKKDKDDGKSSETRKELGSVERCSSASDTASGIFEETFEVTQEEETAVAIDSIFSKVDACSTFL